MNFLKLKTMICDAHIHVDERMKQVLITYKVPAIISCTTPQECEEAMHLCKQYPCLSYSCGIHPWKVDTITWEMMIPYLKQATMIGEIGMDKVWCNQDRESQLLIFTKQLAYASAYKKPVILHTKGEEKTIVELIKQYPNTYLVHWYSCMKYLELYKEENCYFSIGPDVANNEAVQNVVREIELDHLLIESDGIFAIEWAIGPSEDEAYLDILYQTATYIASIKQLKTDEVITQIYRNYEVFLKSGRL